MQSVSTKSFWIQILLGYALIVVLMAGVVYTWVNEWQKIRQQEDEYNHINHLRQQVNIAHMQFLELSLLGETVLEWDAEDMALYRSNRLVLDSTLCDFKNFYPAERIDSVRVLMEDKEAHLIRVMDLLKRQEKVNEEIAQQVPAIAAQSSQEPSPKKRSGFLGIFGKKVEPQSATSSMLNALSKNVISKQKVQQMQLTQYADSIALRNSLLNNQLQELISRIDRKINDDLQEREAAFIEMQEDSFRQIGVLTFLMAILLVVLYLIIHRNITHIIRYKKESAELIERLEKINQRNTELLTDRKNMMLTVSHDLRAPLTAIFGYAELLSGEHRKDAREHYRDAIHSASHRMLGLLNTLLDYHRLDTGKEQPDNIPFQLKILTETLAAEYTIQANEKKLMLYLDYEGVDVPVIGDRGRIIQIAGNLLSNAIKFTKKGEVRLHIRYEAERLVLTVTDTGIGMSNEQLCQIYNPFERFENAEPQEGFGLGMSITLALVKLLKGDIRAESKPGFGSMFTVTLPLSLYTEEFMQQQKKDTIRLPRDMRIAVVENDAVVLKMAARMLSGCKVKVDACSNAGKLMEKLRSTRYDLIITDIMMPDINGYGLLELLRTSNIGNAKCVPVLAMTARAEQSEEEFMKAGFAGCVYKPFSREELTNAVLTCVKQQQSGDKEIDFSVLLTGEEDDREMLELLIRETEKNMAELTEAVKRGDKAKVSAIVHHLLSTWELLRIECPLIELRRALSANDMMDETMREAVKKVEVTAGMLVEQAEEMIKEAKV